MDKDKNTVPINFNKDLHQEDEKNYLLDPKKCDDSMNENKFNQEQEQKIEAILTQQDPDEIPITQGLNQLQILIVKKKKYENLSSQYKSPLMPKRNCIMQMRQDQGYEAIFKPKQRENQQDQKEEDKKKKIQIKKEWPCIICSIVLSFKTQKETQQWLDNKLKEKEEKWHSDVDLNQSISEENQKQENLKYQDQFKKSNLKTIQELCQKEKLQCKINRKENFNDCRQKIQHIKNQCKNGELKNSIEALEHFISNVEQLKKEGKMEKNHNLNQDDLKELLKDDNIREKLKEEIMKIENVRKSWNTQSQENWKEFNKKVNHLLEKFSIQQNSSDQKSKQNLKEKKTNSKQKQVCQKQLEDSLNKNQLSNDKQQRYETQFIHMPPFGSHYNQNIFNSPQQEDFDSQSPSLKVLFEQQQQCGGIITQVPMSGGDNDFVVLPPKDGHFPFHSPFPQYLPSLAGIQSPICVRVWQEQSEDSPNDQFFESDVEQKQNKSPSGIFQYDSDIQSPLQQIKLETL